MVFIVGDKIIHSPIWMRFLPLGVQMVYVHSASAPAKDTEECMVDRMSRDATQRGTFETAFCVGGLKRQQTSCSTDQ